MGGLFAPSAPTPPVPPPLPPAATQPLYANANVKNAGAAVRNQAGGVGGFGGTQKTAQDQPLVKPPTAKGQLLGETGS
jgi:hypothetical protein